MKSLKNSIYLLTFVLTYLTIGCNPILFAQQYSIFHIDPEDTAMWGISIPKDSIAPITIAYAGELPDTVKILLSPFQNSDEEIRYFKIAAGNDNYLDSIFIIKDHYTTLKLNVGNFQIDDEFSGSILIKDEQNPVEKLLLKVKRIQEKKTAVINIDHQQINISTTRNNAKFSFTIFEKNGERPLNRVHLMLSENVGAETFDIQNNLIFTNKSKDTIDLWNTNSNLKQINIEEGENYFVNAEITKLKVGSNTIKFKLAAINSKNDESPELTINLTRKHPLYVPLLVILIAIVFSLFTKKLVSILSSRAILKRRSEKINSSFSLLVPYNAAIIRVKKILKMVDKISKISLSNFQSLEEDLTLAEDMSNYLRRTSTVYLKIDRMPSGMQKRRAKKNYSSVLRDLAFMQMNESNKIRLDNEIAKLESWFSDEETFADLYKKDLEKDINYLLNSFQSIQLIKSFSHIKILEEILQNPDKNVREKENAYAALKIFWEKRKDEKLNEIYETFLENLNVDSGEFVIDDVFRKTDEINWARLKNAGDLKQVTFISPKYVREGTEAFKSIHFEIEPSNALLGENYLFKHGLQYHWFIYFHGRANNTNDVTPLENITDEPRITQFSPISGHITAKVIVKNKDGLDDKIENNTFEVNYDPVPQFKIIPSSFTQLTKSTNKNDAISIIAAAIIAILTGLSSFYLSNDIFGTLKDYILLFLWGAGIEQGTSFLTYLKQD